MYGTYKTLKEYILKNAGKKTAKQMAKEAGVGLGSLGVYASILKVSLISREKIARRERIEDAVRKYAGQKTATDISKMLQVSWSAVDKTAIRLNIVLADHSNKKNRNIATVVKGTEMFNYKAYENWLVG